MARPQFFLITGPNGAGKSTFTSLVRRRFPKTKVIDPDAIAKEITGSYSNIAEHRVFAGKEAIRQVRECIGSGHSFAVESTISGNSYLRYASNAKAAGFRTVLVYIALSSPSLSTERVKIRVSKGGHTIPEHDLHRRYPKSLENLSKHIKTFEIVVLRKHQLSQIKGFDPFGFFDCGHFFSIIDSRRPGHREPAGRSGRPVRCQVAATSGRGGF